MPDPLRITSRHNKRVKDAVRLRTSRERQRTGRFIFDGTREIDRAITAGVRCLEAYVSDEAPESAEFRRALNAIRSAGVETFQVTPEVFAKLAFGDRDDGIVVVAEAPRRGLQDLRLPQSPIVVVLEGLEKPGNVGAILRSADAAGVDAVIIADGRTDLYNPNTIRASLGTVFRENVCETTSAAAIEWLRSKNLEIIAARPEATRSYSDVNFRRGSAIVLGSEADGLTDGWHGPGITPVCLPMRGIADSLNVSTTAAVLFYEALRQRGNA